MPMPRLTEDEKEARRIREQDRQRIANMTPEQIERRNARQRVSYLSNERVERRRQSCREYKLSPEQRERKAKKSRGRWAKILLSGATKNSHRRGHGEPEVTADWIVNELRRQPFCPYTGIRLIAPDEDKNGGRRSPWAPSLDRVDNSKGYTIENTRLTSWFWNCFRGQIPIDEAAANLKDAARCILGVGVENGVAA